MADDEKIELLSPKLGELQASLSRILFETDDSIVVSVTGGWGEGKTFFWKNNVAPEHENKKPGYVSVFHADSLETIQRQVIVEAAAAHEQVHDSVYENIRKVYPFFQKTGRLAKLIAEKLGIPDIPLGFLPQLMEQFVFRPGWVLCLDDIERLPESVSFDALLGYVNSLREDRNIKIVLIYNQDKVPTSKREEALARYTEKIVDREFAFAPEVGEILRKILGCAIQDEKLLAELERRCGVLKLRNIRILRRVKLYYQELVEALPDGVDQEYLTAAIYSLLLFAWIRFARADAGDLTLDYLRSYSEVSAMWRREDRRDEGDDAADDRRERLLAEYGYSHTDDLDLILITFIRTSVLDKAALLEEYEKFRTNVSRGQMEEGLRQAWLTHFHGTLRDTDDDFARDLVEATRNYIDKIPVGQLDASLNMLCEIGRQETANELFDLYMQARPHILEHFDLSTLTQPIRFAPLQEAIDEAQRRAATDDRSIGEVIKSAIKDDFMHREDRERLAEFSAQDLVDYFSANDQPHLLGVMREIAKLTAHQQDESDRRVHANIQAAAKIIAGTSRLNHLRMRTMGFVPKENGQ